MADNDAETGAARDAASEMSSSDALARLRAYPQSNQLIEVILRWLTFNLVPENVQPSPAQLCKFAAAATAKLSALIKDARTGVELMEQLSKLHRQISRELHPDRALQRKKGRGSPVDARY